MGGNDCQASGYGASRNRNPERSYFSPQFLQQERRQRHSDSATQQPSHQFDCAFRSHGNCDQNRATGR